MKGGVCDIAQMRMRRRMEKKLYISAVIAVVGSILFCILPGHWWILALVVAALAVLETIIMDSILATIDKDIEEYIKKQEKRIHHLED